MGVRFAGFAVILDLGDNTLNLSQFAIAAVPVLMACSLVLLIGFGWRGTQIALSVQYLAVFWLVTLNWPIGMAAVKLVVGLMASAVLANTQPDAAAGEKDSLPGSGRIFRGLAALLVWIVVISVSPSVMSMTHASQETSLGSLVLMSMGLLQMAMNRHPARVVIGMLTFLSGFEILYAALEVSVLVAGLLAVINLSLALVGAYLSASPSMESD
jgi:hypothetical protein